MSGKKDEKKYSVIKCKTYGCTCTRVNKYGFCKRCWAAIQKGVVAA